MQQAPEKILVIACGALAREIVALRTLHGWTHLDISCIDAALHNRPAEIAPALEMRINKLREGYDKIFVAYADCGSRGAIDEVLSRYDIERLEGAHCYQFFAGADTFETLSANEPGTFYLTDFLARHFKRFIVQGLKLDLHPQLRDMYFGNYTRLMYLAQNPDANLRRRAREAADFLSLDYVEHVSGYGELESGLEQVINWRRHEKDTRILA